MNQTTHPLAYRLSSKSTRTLMVWVIMYAQGNPGAVTRAGLARVAQQDKAGRLASLYLSPYARP